MHGGWVSVDADRLEESEHIWKGSIFHGRLKDQFSTTALETPVLGEKLQGYFARYLVPRDAVIMDAGCGDGRITHLLLEAGMQRIVSTDLHKSSVDRLLASLSADDRDLVLAIVDDFNRLPVADGRIDVLIAVALFGEMPDCHAALRSAIRMLRPGGLLITSDALLDHALVYALVRNDIDEFLRIARTSTRARMWDQKDQRYRVYTTDELEARILEHPELRILEMDGINMLPSLVFGAVLQDTNVDTEKKGELRDLLLGLVNKGLRINRQAIYICRRMAQSKTLK